MCGTHSNIDWSAIPFSKKRSSVTYGDLQITFMFHSFSHCELVSSVYSCLTQLCAFTQAVNSSRE